MWAATGIKSEISNQKSEIKLFPNPANEKVYLITDAASQDISVEVIDALGSLQMKQSLNSDRSISTSDLNSGFYFIRIYKGTQLLSTQKIIVSH